jgi:hypothetical protein
MTANVSTRFPVEFAPRRDRLIEVATQIHDSLEQESDSIASRPESGPKRAVYVYGEPAIFFQLCTTGEGIVVPSKEIPPTATFFDVPIPTYLVIGPHTRRNPQFQQHWAAAKEHWQLVQAHEYQPSSIVWLDLHDPRLPVPPNAAELNRIEVYRLK